MMESLLTWQEIEEGLERAFAPEQAAHLLKMLGRTQQIEIERAADRRALERGLAELAAAQARTEQRLEELAAAQARTEQRLERLEAAVERLTEAQARTEQRLAELAAAQARTEQRVGGLEAAMERLTEAQARTEVRVGKLAGWQLEHQYRERAMAYFGPLLRRVRVLSLHELEEALEPRLPAAEWEDLLRLDLLLSGRPRHRPEVTEVWLAVEVSAKVDQHDVERALRRAAALRKAGYRTIPTVAGEEIADEAEKAICAGNLLVLQDGRAQFWEAALAAALAD